MFASVNIKTLEKTVLNYFPVMIISFNLLIKHEKRAFVETVFSKSQYLFSGHFEKFSGQILNHMHNSRCCFATGFFFLFPCDKKVH